MDKHEYATLQEFIDAAIENQLYLQSQPPGSQLKELDLKIREEPATNVVVESADSVLSEIALGSVRLDNVQTANGPSDESLSSRYVWGQYNKFLPLKITLRLLVRLLDPQSAWTGLTSLQDEAMNLALRLGPFLNKKDKQLRHRFERRVSTALPNSPKDFRAAERFKNQFVGYITKSGILYGMPAVFKFANINSGSSKSSSVIGITEQGLTFARMPNPILDGQDFNRILSDEESDFLSLHISRNMPDEARALARVISSVKDGDHRPDELNEVLSTLDDDWSPSVVSTMRVGFLSRLWDMGMITREKKGLSFDYSVTERGERFLQVAPQE